MHAEIDAGFWVTEAPALQRAIRNALHGLLTPQTPVPAELSFDHGLEGRVVVAWRNHIVGFVPADRSADLARQLADAAPAPLVAEGTVHRHGDELRIWAGPEWLGDELPQYPASEIEPSPPRIFGIQMNNPR